MGATAAPAPAARTAGWIGRIWSRRGSLALALLPLSLLFACLAGLRRMLYRSGLLRTRRLPVPVVVVGNLTAGGTGKTPLVIALARALRTHGFTPGVVTRGHGGRIARENAGPAAVDGDNASDFGDEAVLIRLQAQVPVFVGRHRFEAGAALLHAHPQTDVILCDDGLQHYSLARDVELALFDARGTGNGWLLPAGPLREPLARLATVDAAVLNDIASLPDGAPRVPVWHMRLQGNEAYLLADPGQRRPLDAFAHLAAPRLLAAAGIGHPQRFFDHLANAGLHCATLPLPDHYDFRDNPFASNPAEIILITEKDAVKCKRLGDPRLWVVPVLAEFDAGLTDLIVEKVRGSSPA